MDDNSILLRIKNDDPRIITELYKKHKGVFTFTLKKRYSWLSNHEIEDFYSDSYNALYRNVKNGKLKKLGCSIQTYIIQIGIHKAIDKIRKDKNKVNKDIIDYLPSEEILSLDFFEKDDLTIRKNKLIAEIVKGLTNPCKLLLNLFWYEGKRDKEIVESTEYTSTSTVKNQRSRCMKTVRKMCLTKSLNEGILSREKFNELMSV
jgi:DNA-directed RNA polymerase specialized sigma24 family protein